MNDAHVKTGCETWSKGKHGLSCDYAVSATECTKDY